MIYKYLTNYTDIYLHNRLNFIFYVSDDIEKIYLCDN